MGEHRESESHRLVGEVLCLDFANTVNGHSRLIQHEYLHDYRDLVLWGRHAGVLTAGETGKLLRDAVVRAAEAEAVFRKGLDLREVIFCIFSALAEGTQANGGDLKHLSTVWQEGQGHALLVRSTNGFSLGWDDEPCLESMLRAVASSAIHLLTSPEVRQVRICDGEHCNWLFVDASRNHLRRWCSMDDCGNRAKMHRRQLKQKLTVTKK